MRAEKFNRRHIAISAFAAGLIASVLALIAWLDAPEKESVSTADFISTTEGALLGPSGAKSAFVRSSSSGNHPLGKPVPTGTTASDKARNRENVETLRSNLISHIEARKQNPLEKKEILTTLEEQLPDDVVAELEQLRLVSVDGELEARFRGQAQLSGFKGKFRLPSGASSDQQVAEVVSSYPAIFGVNDETKLVLEPQCKGSGCTVKVHRSIDGLPVWGGDFTVTVADGHLISARGLFPVRDVDLYPVSKFSEEALIATVADHFGKEVSDIWGSPVIEEGIRVSRPVVFHAFRLEVAFSLFEKYTVFISVQSGRVTDTLSLVQTSFRNASGTDLKGDTQQFRAEAISGGYQLRDDRTPTGGVSEVGTGVDVLSSGGKNLDNARYAFTANVNGGWDPAGVSAITGIRKSLNYFETAHGRRGLRGDGYGTRAFINVTEDGGTFINAMWDGASIYYGAGDGTSYNNFAISIDVAGHEFTHGVIGSTSALVYSFQSGALNESYADFFGVLIDGKDDWLIGEDIVVGDGFFRSMSNPSLGNQPGHMSEFRQLPNTMVGDWGGVHINSGIPNRALYLLAEGLSNEGLGQSTGRDKAGQIAYQTMTTLPSTANFEEAAEATAEQARLLFGAAEEQSVYEAFQAVGLSASAEPPVPPKLPAPETANVVLAVYPTESFNYLNYQIYDSNFAGYNSSLFFRLNSYSAALKRPGVATDVYGNAAGIYFTENNDVVYVDTVSFEETTLVEQSSIQSVAFAQNRTKYSVTYETGNTIFICSLTDNSPCDEFDIRGPDYTSDQTGGTPAALIDAMDWDPTGRLLTFDYAVCVNIPGEDCPYYQWSIGIVNTETGSVSYPFGNQSAEYDIGFPSFSNLTDRYIVFDLVQYTTEAENGEGTSAVLILDTQEMDLTYGALPDAGQLSGPNGTVFGMATFTAYDSGLAYLYHPESGSPQVVFIELEDYELGGNAQYMDPYIANYPISVPRYHRALELGLTASPTALNFGAVRPNSTSSEKICITNEGSARITVSPAESNNLAVTTSLGGAVLMGGQRVCGEVVLNSAGLAAGASFSAVINLPSDGDSLSIAVSGKVSEAGSSASATSFIERFYTNILGRASDPAGLNAWLNVINTQSAAAVAQGFFNSAEFLNKNLDDSAFVDILYRTLFDRAGDPAGTEAWLAELASGRLREMVIWGFLRSVEFNVLAGSFDVLGSNAADQSAYGIRAFVERFYTLVLGRHPDQGGFDNWVTALTNGSYAGGDIAKAFFLSPEYLNQNTSDDDFVNTCYRAFFGREADAGGKQGWMTALGQGKSREYVLDGFIDSAEFEALAASYGIKASSSALTPAARLAKDSAGDRNYVKAASVESVQTAPIPSLPFTASLILSGLLALLGISRLRSGNATTGSIAARL